MGVGAGRSVPDCVDPNEPVLRADRTEITDRSSCSRSVLISITHQAASAGVGLPFAICFSIASPDLLVTTSFG